jgi:M6 family metalloprotease-like protein
MQQRARSITAGLAAFFLLTTARAADVPDLTEYRTTATAIAASVSAVPSAPALPAYLGLLAGQAGRDGVKVAEVEPGSPAAGAGILTGDIVVAIGGVRVHSEADLADVIMQRRPDETVTLTLRRNRRTLNLQATLGATSRPMSVPAGGRRDRTVSDEPPPPAMRPDQPAAPRVFTKPVYRLAAIPVQFPDVPLNQNITTDAWTEALFSTGTYAGKMNPTGQPVFGSLNDYYREVSCGALEVQGKVLAPVTMSQPRASYGQGTGSRSKTPFLIEALEAVSKRDGAASLDEYDGVLFIYAGARVATTRGGLYWPHRSSVQYGGKRRPYVIVPEGGLRMTNISVIVHEFGHMLGLPDLYARPENPGSEGAGVWCVMSQQAGNGRPQHMSAWCKERMGWIKPVVLDPNTPQKLILSPIEGSRTECYKVLVRPDGGEYLLLENRRKRGFDESLPAEGLLIWRVVGSRPILEESHGIEGPAGPASLPSSVPYPSGANNAFTPYTLPSSRSQLGGGWPVYITNIQRLSDGRVIFHIGHRFH